MKFLTLNLLFLFFTVHAALAEITPNFSPAGTMNIGGINLSTAKTIVLHTSIFSNTHSTLYKVSGTTRAAYQVPVGKTFIVDAVCYDQATASGTAVGNYLLYADNNLNAINSASALTNPVGVASGVASGSEADAYATTAVIGYHCVQYSGSIPASKYAYVKLVGSHDILTVYGHEQ